MKKWKSYLLLGMLSVGITLVTATDVSAAPANSQINVYKQPSGQEFEAQLVGDEYLNYTIANGTGDLVNMGQDGYWYYSMLDEQTKTATASKSKYLLDEKPSDSLTIKDINKLERREPEESKVRTLRSETKWNKEQNVLVVLVEFDDAKLTYSETDWENRIFSQTSKSLASYYKEATKDTINIVPAKEKHGKQDGVVRVKLNQNHPNGGSNSSLNLPSLKSALESIQDLVDLSEYDTNRNGIIEQNELHIMGIFAGYEASSSDLAPSVWGHKWSFQGQEIGSPVVNGKRLQNYTLFGERMLKKKGSVVQHEYQSELGIVAHEFGHDLGLPDLYNSEQKIIEQDGKYVSVSDGDGLGAYSLMASGSWNYLEGENSGATPGLLDAYSKVSLGIVTPTIIDKTTTVSVNHISEAGFNLFRVNTSDPQEYFLVENRQLTGYDASLQSVRYSAEHGYKKIVASGGIAIYHVNEKHRRNFSSEKQLVTLKEADEGVLGYSKLKQARYYTTNNYDGFYYKGMGGHDKPQQTTLTKQTTPSTAISTGSYPDFEIQVSSEASPAMSVTFKGNPIAVSSVLVDPVEAAVTVGQTKQLTSKIMPENADNKNVTWTSSNNAIATVSATGVVTAKTAGTTKITVTTEDGKKAAVSTITVKTPVVAVSGVSVSPASKELEINGTQQLSETIAPSNATNKKVSWNSSNSNIATVSSSGLVTAKAVGTAVIKVITEDGNKTAAATITVRDNKTGANFDDALSMNLNELYALTIKETKEKYYAFKPSTTGDYGFVSEGKLDWSAYLYDETKTQIGYNDDGNGSYQFKLLNKLEAGKTYYLKVYNRNVFGDNTIKVYPVVRATEVTLTPTVKTMKEGDKHQLTGNISPKNATEDETLSWSSSDTKVATVSNTGEIEAKMYGTVTITAKSRYSGVSNRMTLEVTSDKTGSSFEKASTLEINKATDVCLTDAREKYYAFKPSTTGDYGFVSEGKLDWSAYLYDETKTQIGYNDDGNGSYQFKLLNKLEAGKTYYLKVYNRNVFGDNTIKVYPVVRATEVTLTPTVKTMKEGDKHQLTGNISPKNATEDETLSWSSSDTKVATVSNTGEIEAKMYGTVTITAKSRYSGVSNRMTLEVTSDKTGSSFEKASTLEMNKATDVSLTDAREKYYAFKPSTTGDYGFVSEGKLDWSAYLYDETKTQIGYNDDGNGSYQFKLLNKLEAGKTYYLKVYNRNVFGDNTIKVYPVVRATEVTLTPTVKTMKEGDKHQLTGNISPKNATEDETLSWSSSDTKVATVSNTGEIEAKMYGTVTITAKSRYSGVSNRMTLEVTSDKTGSSFEKASTLEMNKATDVSLTDAREKYYAFKPSTTGDYGFVSEGKLDWSAYLYDETKTQIGYNDDGNGSYQFKLLNKLEAGKTYYLKVYNRNVFGDNTIKVYPVVRATEVTLTPTVKTMKEGDKHQLTGNISPKNATEDETLSWSSSDTKVATVSNTGEIEAKMYGTVTITAKSRYSGVSNRMTLEVTSDKTGSSFEKASTLEMNKATDVSLTDAREKYYAFKPSTTGDYGFVSEGKLDWSAYLYDETKTQIGYNDDGNGSYQFKLLNKLEAGKTYYLKVYNRNVFGDNIIRVTLNN